MASVILQNSHHLQHSSVQVNSFSGNNRNNKSSTVINNNNGGNGGNFSSASSSSSAIDSISRYGSGEAGGSNGNDQQGQVQQSNPQRPVTDGNSAKPEGVSSAPKKGVGKVVITRAVLAQKYLVQFDDADIETVTLTVDDLPENQNNNNISSSGSNISDNNNNNKERTISRIPHVGPTKSPLKCLKLATKEVMQCKITLRDERGVSILAAHQRLGECADYINPISELIVHPKYFYLISPPTYGNLHSYVYSKSFLKETEAKNLFKQMVSIVNFCHSRGVILRDIKLGRFVFADKERTIVKLESLDDVVILPKPDSQDDKLDDRHGCPNYVSPEKTECVVKNGSVKYSGKTSDVWALGISLYAMLAGRYPFMEHDCSRLLRKIRTGSYSPIDGISPFAKSLVRCLLVKNPLDRPSGMEILNHPWFRSEYPQAKPVPVIRALPATRDMDTLDRDCRAKRMRMSGDDDQVVPGS